MSHIGMSYAFRQSGYLAGIVLLGLVAIMTGKERWAFFKTDCSYCTLIIIYKKKLNPNAKNLSNLFANQRFLYDLDYSTTILLRSGQMAKVTTYQELVYNVLGKSGYLWLSLVQFLYPFICLISYNIIIGIIKKHSLFSTKF